VEVIQQLYKNEYTLKEIFINPAHIVFLREDTKMNTRLSEGKLPKELDDRQSFTRVQVHNGTTGTEFVVVGAPHLIESKLKDGKKELLYG